MKEVNLADSTGSIFTLKTVDWPDTIQQNVPFAITGEIDLFGLSFLAPIWILAKVTYPKEWWEIIGSPITSKGAFVLGGKFTLKFDDGFSRTGKYGLEISVFGGPTTAVSAGAITSVSTNIPPIPALITLPDQSFDVTKTEDLSASVEKTSIIYTPEDYRVELGGKITAAVTVKNIGEIDHKFTFRLDLKSSDRLTVNEGDEKSSDTVAPGDSTTVTLSSIAVPSDWPTGSTITPRLILIGLEGVWDTGPDFTIPSTAVDDVVQKQTITYAPSSGKAPLGSLLSATVTVKNIGNAARAFTFRLDLKNSQRLTVNEGQETNSDSIAPGDSGSVTVNSIAVPSDWPVGSAITPRLILIGHEGVWDTGPDFTIPDTSPTKQSIVYTPSSYQVGLGKTITANVTLVNPASTAVQVTLRLDLKNSERLTVNEGKEVSGSIPANGSGTITLNSIAVPNDWPLGSKITPRLIFIGKEGVWDTGPDFTIAGTGNASLIVSPASVNSGGSVNFQFSGFTSNATVTLSIEGNPGEGTTAQADATGAGSGSFGIVGDAGPYTLTAEDDNGNKATALFVITVLPILRLDPNKIKTGDTLTMTLANFSPNSQVTSELLTQEGSIISTSTITTDANGGYTAVIKITGTPGMFFIYVKDTAGNEATAPFTITENITGLVVSAVTFGGYGKLAVGDGASCSAQVQNADGTTQNVSQTVYTLWSSSDPSIATVDQYQGSVMGVKVGTVNINAKYTGPLSGAVVTGSVQLQIVATQAEEQEPNIYSINITPTNPASLNPGGTQTFDAYVMYNTGDQYVYHLNDKVRWYTDNAAIATVNNGSTWIQVTAVAVGTCHVWAEYGGKTSNRVAINVVAATSPTGALGRVVDSVTQNAIAGVTVTIGGLQANTDSGGNWSMKNISVGSQTISYSLPGYLNHTSWAFTFKSGVNNGVGTQALSKITNNYITVRVTGPSSTFWQIVLKDAAGKTLTMSNIPWGTDQKLYVPDDWTWPATFMAYADLMISSDTASQTGMVQSFGSNFGGIYTIAKITSTGTWTINLSTGAVNKS